MHGLLMNYMKHFATFQLKWFRNTTSKAGSTLSFSAKARATCITQGCIIYLNFTQYQYYQILQNIHQHILHASNSTNIKPPLLYMASLHESSQIYQVHMLRVLLVRSEENVGLLTDAVVAILDNIVQPKHENVFSPCLIITLRPMSKNRV